MVLSDGGVSGVGRRPVQKGLDSDSEGALSLSRCPRLSSLLGRGGGGLIAEIRTHRGWYPPWVP